MQDHGTTLEERTRKYSSLKYGLAIAETVIFLVFLFIISYSGVSARLSLLIGSFAKTASQFVIAPFFVMLLGLVYYAVTFPVVFYQSFLLEYQFGLSRQSLASWFADQAKSGALGFVFTVIVIEALYAIITVSPGYWWLLISAFLVFFNLVLAIVAPVLIIPLFYKCSRFQDGGLRARIEQLASAMKIKLLDIYKLDFSKKTVKANAGLTGWGATKRVILADTLLEKYTENEILTILAHEFGHYVGKHLVQLVAIGAAATVGFFWAISVLGPGLLRSAGVESWLDPAGLPFWDLLHAVLFCHPAVHELDKPYFRAPGRPDGGRRHRRSRGFRFHHGKARRAESFRPAPFVADQDILLRPSSRGRADRVYRRGSACG
jgi:STE24 endopeptidase